MTCYKLETRRADHICETMAEVRKKARLAVLLNEWVRVYKTSKEGWTCVFNWPARKLSR
jgi:hypothetical protein